MRTGSTIKKLLVLVLAFSVVLAACGAVGVAQPVVDLAGVDQLAEDFNAVDSDSPRLILLLSPT